jgi:rubrerythrin
MLSTYKQVDDVLNTARWFHNRLAEFYDDLSKRTDEKKVKLMLQYMSSEEQKFEKALTEFVSGNGRKLTKTWMHYAPDLDLDTIPRADEIKEVTLEKVVSLGMDMDEKLSKFYNDAIDFADYDELKTLFGKLKEQEETKKAEIAKNAAAVKHSL